MIYFNDLSETSEIKIISIFLAYIFTPILFFNLHQFSPNLKDYVYEKITVYSYKYKVQEGVNLNLFEVLL